jgi:hypothetical protein
MKTANITWELPAKRPFAADLSGVRVFLSGMPEAFLPPIRNSSSPLIWLSEIGSSVL